MSQFPRIPVARLQHDQIVLFQKFDSTPPRSDRQIENQKNLTRGQYNGYMSPKTKSKVKKYLATWCDSVQTIRRSKSKSLLDKIPYLTFVTLTLPANQLHSDNEIKRKCLTPFIQTLQRKYDVWYYFWRAEAQENGNIHFHLLVDSYIHYLKLRKDWNQCVNKLGYVDRFEAVHSHRNPNSTDIRRIHNKNSVASYVIKYCCKADGYRKIDGRIHGCADELRTLTPYEDLVGNELSDFVMDVWNDHETKVIEDSEFVVIKCSLKKMIRRYNPSLQKKLDDYRTEQILSLYRVELPQLFDESPPIISEKKQKLKQLHFSF